MVLAMTKQPYAMLTQPNQTDKFVHVCRAEAQLARSYEEVQQPNGGYKQGNTPFS